MFGLSEWERVIRKLNKHSIPTEGTVINKETVIEKGILTSNGGPVDEPRTITVVDIEFTTDSGKKGQLHCGGEEIVQKYEVGDKVPVAYIEYNGKVFGKLRD